MSSRQALRYFIWLVPLAAALICIALLLEALNARGPNVTISFVTAEGLEPGKTKLRYRNLDIGSVKAIRLSNDHAAWTNRELMTLLDSRSVLIVGMSLTDPNVRRLLAYLQQHPEELRPVLRPSNGKRPRRSPSAAQA